MKSRIYPKGFSAARENFRFCKYNIRKNHPMDFSFFVCSGSTPYHPMPYDAISYYDITDHTTCRLLRTT